MEGWAGSQSPCTSANDRYNCPMSEPFEHDNDGGVQLAPARPRLQPPSQWQVFLLNDDYTPMDFVVEVLQRFFLMDSERATQVMLHVHTRGRGLCGVYTREVAETKVALVNDHARDNHHPLLCVMEKA